MPVKPVVRYMILCEDWGLDPDNPRRINIFGLLNNINSVEEPPYPLLFPELCVFLALTETRGKSDVQIICVFEETGQRIFGSPKRHCSFGNDPLKVVGLPIRIHDCWFPHPGLYSIQFWYNDEIVEERPLLLR